mgnify:FL=1|tara:strand:+ start:2677 stop:4176 length:1500 start_codon:yes stop_codon:yes gene_type:complete
MQLGRFQVTDAKAFAGMINPENTLGAIWKTSPTKINDAMIKLLAINRGKSLENMLAKFETKMVDNDNEFYWELIGSSRRNIPLVEASFQGATVTNSDNNIGEGGQEFQLTFDEHWFFKGELIVGEKNEVYPIRLLDDGYPSGSQWVYTCEIAGSDRTGIPGSELIAGKRFTEEFAPVGKGLSREVGGIRRVTPISMRGELTTIRIDHKLPGDATNKQVVMGIPVIDKAGNKKVFGALSLYEDWLVEQEFSLYKNKFLMYGKTNRTADGQYHNKDVSGRKIQIGSGIREQMEQSNTYFYNDFSIELLEEILFGLSEGKLGFDNRVFILRTGERGAAEFHKAVLQTTSGWSANMSTPGTNPATVMSTPSPLHKNSMKAGFQFVEYLAPNGVCVKLEVDDFYDDKIRNTIKIPGSNGVAESYRFDIFYMGTTESPNIQKVQVKGKEEIRGYQWGFRNPFTGAVNNGNMGTLEDSGTITKWAQLGVVVYDASRTASIIPYVLA